MKTARWCSGRATARSSKPHRAKRRSQPPRRHAVKNFLATSWQASTAPAFLAGQADANRTLRIPGSTCARFGAQAEQYPEPFSRLSVAVTRRQEARTRAPEWTGADQ